MGLHQTKRIPQSKRCTQQSEKMNHGMGIIFSNHMPAKKLIFRIQKELLQNNSFTVSTLSFLTDYPYHTSHGAQVSSVKSDKLSIFFLS